LTLLYRASLIWCIGAVYKVRVTFGIEFVLKIDFYLQNIPKNLIFIELQNSVALRTLTTLGLIQYSANT